jgi:hypothetical protein
MRICKLSISIALLTALLGLFGSGRVEFLESVQQPKQPPLHALCVLGRGGYRFTVSRTSETGVLWCRFQDQKGSSG